MKPKHVLIFTGWVVLGLSILLIPSDVCAWGGKAHRWVNEKACERLPAEMAGFRRWAGVLGAHASDADIRKGTDPLESSRHWIDIDNFPEFFQGTLSHHLDSLVQKHNRRLDVYGNGVVPWVIASVTETLTVAMAQGDWNEVLRRAADLGHYVADSYQPLHTTKNYDGQLTGNDGVHLRYEIDMLDRNLQELVCAEEPVAYRDVPLEDILQAITLSWSYVDSIMKADRAARARSSGYDQDYYRALWERTGPFTIRQLCLATGMLADLWYTAWVDAGRPPFPSAPAVACIADVEATPHLLDLVTIQGVVTVGSGVLDDHDTRIYVQDESGRGIFIYHHQPADSLLRGDSVRVEGMVHDHRGITEITGPSFQVLKRGCSLLPPRAVFTREVSDPCWENTLIQIRGTVVFILEDDDWTRLHVDDGSGAAIVMIWRQTGIDLSAVKEGHVLSVAGVGTYLSDEGSAAILPGYEDQVRILESGN